MFGFTPADIIKIGLTAISVFFGFWQYLRKRKIQQMLSSEAISLHNNIAVALGATDAAITAITNAQSAHQVGRAQGICQAILNQSAKLYCDLKHPSWDDIETLVRDGQLKEQYREIYNAFATPRRSWFGRLLKSLFG